MVLPVLFSSQLGSRPVVGIGFLATSPKEGSGSPVYLGVIESLTLGARPVKPQAWCGGALWGRTCCFLLALLHSTGPVGQDVGGWVGVTTWNPSVAVGVLPREVLNQGYWFRGTKSEGWPKLFTTAHVNPFVECVILMGARRFTCFAVMSRWALLSEALHLSNTI